VSLVDALGDTFGIPMASPLGPLQMPRRHESGSTPYQVYTS